MSVLNDGSRRDDRLHVELRINVLLLSADEAFTAKARGCMDWEGEGYTLLCARDGREAEERLKAHTVHCLLLDGALPAETLITLSRLTYEAEPRCGIAVFAERLTMTLARQCLRLQAVDVLLKAETDTPRMRALMSVMRDQFCLRIQYTRLPPLDLQHTIMRQELQNGVFINQVSSRVPEWLSGVRTYRLVLLQYAFSYPADKRDIREDDGHVLLYVRILHDILANIGGVILMYVGERHVCLCFYQKAGLDDREDVEGTMRLLVSALLIQYHTRSRWIASAPETDPQKMPALYEAMRREAFAHQGGFDMEQNLYWTMDDEDRLLIAVKAGNVDWVTSFFETRVREVAYEEHYEQAIHLFTTGVLMFANKLYAKYGVEDSGDLFGREGLDIYDTQALGEWCVSIFTCLIDSMAEKAETGAEVLSPFIRNALGFICAHADEGPLRLTDVSRHCRVSPAYLSRTFKKEVGLSFSSYLNQLRIYHSLELTGHGTESLQIVSERVGFNNYSIFFAYFKKLIGIAPIEYRAKPFNVEIGDIFKQ